MSTKLPRHRIVIAVAALLLGAVGGLASSWALWSRAAEETERADQAVVALEDACAQVEKLGAVCVQDPEDLRGDPGAEGPPGPQGEPGEDGSDGADGSPGADGEDGATGPPGADGADGSDGVAGEPGPAGPQGEPGPQGPAGEDGEDGEDARTCPDGFEWREETLVGGPSGVTETWGCFPV